MHVLRSAWVLLKYPCPGLFHGSRLSLCSTCRRRNPSQKCSPRRSASSNTSCRWRTRANELRSCAQHLSRDQSWRPQRKTSCPREITPHRPQLALRRVYRSCQDVGECSCLGCALARVSLTVAICSRAGELCQRHCVLPLTCNSSSCSMLLR